VTRRLRFELRQQLRDIDASFGKRACPVGIIRIVAQELCVLFHRRPAPGRVDDDVVERSVAGAARLTRLERVDKTARGDPRVLDAACMEHQGATALLPLRDHDLAPLRGQHSGGGVIDLRKEHALHAAEKEPHTPAGRSSGGDGRWQLVTTVWWHRGRREPLERRKASGKHSGQAGCAEGALDAQALRRSQRPSDPPQAPRIR